MIRKLPLETNIHAWSGICVLYSKQVSKYPLIFQAVSMICCWVIIIYINVLHKRRKIPQATPLGAFSEHESCEDVLDESEGLKGVRTEEEVVGNERTSEEQEERQTLTKRRFNRQVRGYTNRCCVSGECTSKREVFVQLRNNYDTRSLQTQLCTRVQYVLNASYI